MFFCLDIRKGVFGKDFVICFFRGKGVGIVFVFRGVEYIVLGLDFIDGFGVIFFIRGEVESGLKLRVKLVRFFFNVICKVGFCII